MGSRLGGRRGHHAAVFVEYREALTNEFVIGHMATIKPEHDPLGTHKEVARRGAQTAADRS